MLPAAFGHTVSEQERRKPELRKTAVCVSAISFLNIALA